MKKFFLILLIIFHCIEREEYPLKKNVVSFLVQWQPLFQYSEGTPIEVSSEWLKFSIDITAVEYGGIKPKKDFNSWVRISSEPGELKVKSSENTYKNYVFLTNGEVKNVEISLRLAFGNTYIWVEDDGFSPPREGIPSCSNKIDDDGDGMIDFPFDDGCFSENDNSEGNPSYAFGISKKIPYGGLTISIIQGKGAKSPFQNKFVVLDKGEMVVTRISSDGFYVTDFSEKGNFNHIYAYNYSTPVGMRVCDRIKTLAGIISEFYGFTELNFPLWKLEEWDEKKEDCPIKDPYVLKPQDVGNNLKMEGYEAGLVRIKDGVFSDEFKNCDIDGNGKVDYINEGTEESWCRDKCEKKPLCTELTQYNQYGQFAVALNGGIGPKIYVLTREGVPEFDPLAHKGETFVSITGTLKNISFLMPTQWIVEPRCIDDIILTGSIPLITKTCIKPRTGEEDEPN